MNHVSRGRVLVAEDEAALLEVFVEALSDAGFETEGASSGREAMQRFDGGGFDLVLSDIDMPDMNGINLLRAIRARDLDMPVVFVTGSPRLETAIAALENGALLYLLKPVALDVLERAVVRAVSLGRLARAKREALAVLGDAGKPHPERATLEPAFDRVLTSLWMAFQPIVISPDLAPFGHEALLRAEEPLLPHPGAIIDAAERLGRMQELGRRVRAEAALSIASCPGHVFVNLHPRDLLDDDLFSPQAPLSAHASRVVLEITERASLDSVADARGRVAALRSMGFRIAIDDLGAGYAGLTSFALLEPDVVKIDMALVRDVDTVAVKRALVGSMAALGRDLGIAVVAEGIETDGELQAVIAAGCGLLQGYLLGRPAARPEWR